MASAAWFCPLCDGPVAAERCPAHDVPAIAPLDEQRPVEKLSLGTVLGRRFRVEKVLNEGGMGVLLLARAEGAAAPYVLKILRSDKSALAVYLRRFYLEARAIRLLDHENIVRLVEFGFDAPTRVPYLVMEHVEGRTLKEVLRQRGPMAEAEAAAILLEVARALEAAHERSVLHRDLKPSNIMLADRPDGSRAVKVLDFGVAKILEDDVTPPLTMPGRAVGTPSYMSPEQIVQGTQDFRTDLYGLGCMLHAMLTGSAPYEGIDRLEVMRRQVRDPPPVLPATLIDGAPPSSGLSRLHRALLAKHRAERPASTAEVVRSFSLLAKALVHPSDEATRPLTSALVQAVLGRKAGIAGAKTILDAPAGSDDRSQPGSSGGDSQEEVLTSVLPSSLMSESQERTPVAAPEPRAETPRQGTGPSVETVLKDTGLSISTAGTRDGTEPRTPVAPMHDPTPVEMTAWPAAAGAREARRAPATETLVPVRIARRNLGLLLGLGAACLVSFVSLVLVYAMSQRRAPEARRLEREQKDAAVAAPDATADPPSRARLLRLEAQPERAAVYEGSAFLGTTPLILSLPEGVEKRLRLESSGHVPREVEIDGVRSGSLLVTLERQKLDKKERRRKGGDFPSW